MLGVWLVEQYRSVFAQEISAGGIDGLITKLAERNKAAAEAEIDQLPQTVHDERTRQAPGRCLRRRGRAAQPMARWIDAAALAADFDTAAIAVLLEARRLAQAGGRASRCEGRRPS